MTNRYKAFDWHQDEYMRARLAEPVRIIDRLDGTEYVVEPDGDGIVIGGGAITWDDVLAEPLRYKPDRNCDDVLPRWFHPYRWEWFTAHLAMC